MSHTESEHPVPESPAGEHSSSSAPAAGPFSPGEIAALQEADRAAARNIVLLFTTLFIVGLIGYTIISIWVSQG